MFLFLSKLLPLFVYPLGLACLLIVAALALRRYPAWQTGCLVAALVILFGFGNQSFANRLVQRLEWQYLPDGDIPPADVIVLLGGGTRPAQPPRPISELNEGGDRMVYAAQLYHTGKAPKILVSGGYIDWLGSTTPEAESMAEVLALLGVPNSVIWREARSRNTYENALYTKEILAAKGIDRIILVTSALHMPRSVKIFERQGFDVIPAPVDFMVTASDESIAAAERPASRFLHLVPNVEYLYLSTRALKEFLGTFIYRLQGWL